MIFCKAISTKCRNIGNILQTYEEASGQKINMDKFECLFSKTIGETETIGLSDVIGVQKVNLPGLYLGMPIHNHKNKKGLILS